MIHKQPEDDIVATVGCDRGTVVLFEHPLCGTNTCETRGREHVARALEAMADDVREGRGRFKDFR